MNNLTDREKLTMFKNIVSIPLLNTDPVKWPIRSSRAGAKCFMEYSEAIVKTFEQIFTMKDGIQKTSKAFENPSRIWRMSHHILRSLKQSDVSIEKRQSIMIALIDVISNIKTGSVFNNDGYNIIYNDNQLSDNISEIRFSHPNHIKESKEIHFLFGALWAYSEAMYFVAHSICVEMHGMYQINNEQFLVRDYSNLAPSELWGNLDFLPYKKIRATTFYNQELELEIDIYNNPYIKKGDYVNSMTRYSIEVDGSIIDLNEVNKLRKLILEKTKKLIFKIEGMSENDKAKKYIEIFWYRLKPIFDLLNQDWRPPNHIFSRIDKEGIPPRKTSAADPGKIYNLLDCYL